MTTTPCCQPPGPQFDNKKRVIVIEEELLALEREIDEFKRTEPLKREQNSAQIKEIVQLRSALKECAEALEYVGCHEHEGFDESNSHYNQTCSVCQKTDKALSNPIIQQLLKGEKE